MSIWEKIKLLLWLKGLPGQLAKVVLGGSKMGSKLGALLGKLDGLKSIAGLLMIVGYYVAPHFGISVPDVVLKIGTGFASVGLAMKLEKGLGLLSKGINLAKQVLDVVQLVVNALAAKLPAKA